jgi:NDP-sugar pyrophosphorylase family protein
MPRYDERGLRRHRPSDRGFEYEGSWFRIGSTESKDDALRIARNARKDGSFEKVSIRHRGNLYVIFGKVR